MATESEIKIIMTLDDQVSAKLETIKLKQDAVRMATEEVTKQGKIYATEEARKLDILKKAIELSDKNNAGLMKQADAVRKVEYELNRMNPAANTFNNTLGRIEGQTVKANSQLTAMGRIIQDAPYGFNAISNNISNTIEQMGYLVTSSGGLKGAISALGATLFSTSGLMIALASVPGIIQFFRGTGQEAKTSKDELRELNEEFQTTINLRDELLGVKFSFANSADAENGKKILEDQNKLFQNQIDLANKSLAGNAKYENNLALIASGVQGVEASIGKLSRAQQDASKELIKYNEDQIRSGQSSIDKITLQIEKQRDLEREIIRMRSAGGDVDIKVKKTTTSTDNSSTDNSSTDNSSTDLYYQELKYNQDLEDAQIQSEAFVYEERNRHEIEIQQLKQEGIIANNNNEIIAGYEELDRRKKNIEGLALWAKKFEDDRIKAEDARIAQFEARGQADADRRAEQLANEEKKEIERAKRTYERNINSLVRPIAQAIVDGQTWEENMTNAAKHLKVMLLDAFISKAITAAVEWFVGKMFASSTTTAIAMTVAASESYVIAANSAVASTSLVIGSVAMTTAAVAMKSAAIALSAATLNPLGLASIFAESGGSIPARESGGMMQHLESGGMMQHLESGGMMQRLESGGNSNMSRVMVGERGQEMVDLPVGSRVHSAGETRGMSQGITINIHADSASTGQRIIDELQFERKRRGVSTLEDLFVTI